MSFPCVPLLFASVMPSVGTALPNREATVISIQNSRHTHRPFNIRQWRKLRLKRDIEVGFGICLLIGRKISVSAVVVPSWKLSQVSAAAMPV